MIINETKVCVNCNIEKDISEFTKHPKGKLGRNPRCRDCRTTDQQKYRERNGYANQIKYKYGITMSEYNNYITLSNNKCPLCNIEYFSTGSRLSQPCIDHDHTTNKVRGVICHACNVALGLVRDNKLILQKMLEYLK
jgi:hypothetical protein